MQAGERADGHLYTQGPGELAEVRLGGNKCRVGEKVEFVIEVPEKGEVKMDHLTAEVMGPGGAPLHMDFDPRDGKGSFTPKEYGNPCLLRPSVSSSSGMHEVLVTNEGEAVRGCPSYVRSMPNSKKDYDGIEPCAVGSTVEVRKDADTIDAARHHGPHCAVNCTFFLHPGPYFPEQYFTWGQL